MVQYPMPAWIPTAQILSLDPETLEVNDTYPGTYGFYLRLTSDPGSEWAAEFEAAYDQSVYTIKPPVAFRGNTIVVFFLPLYEEQLPEYLQFLRQVIDNTNQSVEKRNGLLPEDESIKEAFRTRLRQLTAEDFLQKR
jgi:hypothetical protein